MRDAYKSVTHHASRITCIKEVFILMKVIIDRFEENYAVVELSDKKTVDLPLELVPEGGKEGDVLDITIDYKETDKRKEEIENLMEDMWKE